MSKVIFVCDGCGEQAEGSFGSLCEAHKPAHWYARRDEDGVQVACSRACIKTISERTNKTSLVLPV
jgi:hypothetical protein